MQPRDTIHTQNQCIFQVPAFISNARPFIQYIKSYLSRKILFLKFSFFKKISLIFILFYFSKKKFRKFFTVHYSLFIVTVHLSCNTIQVLQYNPQQPSSLPHCNTLRCIAIQFNHLSSLLFTIHKGVLQYNF